MFQNGFEITGFSVSGDSLNRLVFQPACINVPVMGCGVSANLANGFIYSWKSEAKEYKSWKKYKLYRGNNKLQIHGISNVPLMAKKSV